VSAYLVQEIWDSLAAGIERASLTEAQRQELERRQADSVARPDAVGKSQGAHPGEGAAVSLPIVFWSFGDSPDRPLRR